MILYSGENEQCYMQHGCIQRFNMEWEKKKSLYYMIAFIWSSKTEKQKDPWWYR